MSKFCKFFVSIMCFLTVASTANLFADSETRKAIIAALDNLKVNFQGTVVDFLYDLNKTHKPEFPALFNYVVYGRGALGANFFQDLREKNLIKADNDDPSETLVLTFNLLKQIIDDFNKENKDNCFNVCCKKCCCGCFDLWRREHGMGKLDFTLNNVVALLAALSNKGSIHRSQETVELLVEQVLEGLATHTVD